MAYIMEKVGNAPICVDNQLALKALEPNYTTSTRDKRQRKLQVSYGFSQKTVSANYCK